VFCCQFGCWQRSKRQHPELGSLALVVGEMIP
jgi:hypothetical protein